MRRAFRSTSRIGPPRACAQPIPFRMGDVARKPGIQRKTNASESEQILGVAAHGMPQPKIDPRWEPFYRKLLRLRDYIIDQETDLTAKAREIEPKYLQREAADVSSEEFQRDFALGKISADQDLLADIEEALDRIEAGTYGTCQLTGKPIPLTRLHAVPWTRFTVEAEEQIEREGGGIHPHLSKAAPLNETGTEAGQT